MPKKSEKINELTYECALKRIEEIAALLEEGEITMDESLSLFEESVRLTVFCEKILRETEQKIRTVTEKNPEEEN